MSPKDTNSTGKTEEIIPIRMSLKEATCSLMRAWKGEGGRDIGVALSIKQFTDIFDVTNPMIYAYRDERVTSVTAERALVFLDKFNILLDEYNSAEELRNLVKNANASITLGGYDALKKEIYEAGQCTNFQDMKPIVLKAIARHC
jgi:hypothetical protein